MSKSSDEAIARFTAEVYRRAEKANVSDNIWPVITGLPPIARRLHKLFEAQCNGFQTWDGRWDEKAEKRAEAREQRLLTEARELAAQAGATVYVQGDPRGWPLHLIWPGDLKPGETADSYYNLRGVGVPF